jgi:hypothetical protein
MVQAGWDDVPHLDAATKAEMLESIPPHLRDARTKGTPSFGSGAIYPVEQAAIIVDPFPIPRWWAKGYGLDVGWNKTAAIFGTHDRDSDVVYLYSEHYRGQAELSVHAEAIKARGEWLRGAIDPASAGAGQIDGRQVLANYQDLGLDVIPANNAVEAGLQIVWQMLSTGRLKVFSTLSNWLNEHRLYRRDERGRIVKERDHLMDATRYLCMMLGQVMQTPQVARRHEEPTFAIASKIGGY